MFVNTGGNGENIGIKNNIFRRKINLFCQDFISPLTYFDFSGFGIRLPFFIKGHNDHCCAITTHKFGVFNKSGFAFFKRNGIHHSFALDTFKTGFQNIPFRRIQHNRHFGDIRFRGNQHQKPHHCFFGLQHALVHVDVYNLGAILNLLFGNVQRRFKITFDNQPFKRSRTGYIGPFANINKQTVLANRHGFKTRQPTFFFNLGNNARRMHLHGLNDGFNRGR